MRESTDYPPGPGTLARCVRAIAGTRSGDPAPADTGPRHGQIGAGRAVGQIMSGMTSRVPGMTRIFARAREIRAAGLVPPDLWGRFASEVMAELEFDPDAQVSEQMRRCMAHARQWREERGLSWDPEIERAFRAEAAP